MILAHHRKSARKHRVSHLPSDIEALLNTGDTAAADALVSMTAAAEPETAKAARRALHQLSLRGIRPSRESPGAGPQPEIIRHTKQGWNAARMSLADFTGDRMIAMSPSEHAGRVVVFLIDASGTVGKVTKQPISLAEFAESLPVVRDKRLLTASVPADYARYRIHEAVRLTRERNALRPLGLSDALAAIGPCERVYDRSLVYEHMEASGNLTVAADQKALERELATLTATFDTDALVEFLQTAFKLLTSRVVLTDQQRQNELKRVLRNVVNRMMPTPVYEEGLRRLEDHALVYFLNGDTAAAHTVLSEAARGRQAGGPDGWSSVELAATLALAETVQNAADRAGLDRKAADEVDDDDVPIIHVAR